MAASEKLGVRPCALYVGELVDSFDVLVIVSGNNDRQVRSIAEEVERLVGAAGRTTLREEGWGEGEWIALDYGDVIVHVFDDEHRSYYDLEHLWNTALSFTVEVLR